MAKYKNISSRDLWVPGVGTIKAGESAEMPEGFRNANFKEERPARKKDPEESKAGE